MTRSAAAPARPPFGSSVLRVFDVSLGEMLWSRRSAFLALLVGAPVSLAAIIRLVSIVAPESTVRANGQVVSGPTLFGVMVWLLYVRFIVPVLGVFYGTALIADEVDDRTLTYLFTRPIRRGAVLLGKYVAYLVCTLLLLLPSVVLGYFLVVPLAGGSIAAAFPSLVKDLGMLAAGLAAYGALFAWVGARLKRPLVAGLVFVMGWEPGVLLFPGYLKRLTIAYYLQGLVPHALPESDSTSSVLQVFSDVPSAVPALVALAVITAAALWMGMRTVDSREYVLEQ
jgi:ABC-2 type transport system permease protein